MVSQHPAKVSNRKVVHVRVAAVPPKDALPFANGSMTTLGRMVAQPSLKRVSGFLILVFIMFTGILPKRVEVAKLQTTKYYLI